jgi:hypothetical protein
LCPHVKVTQLLFPHVQEYPAHASMSKAQLLCPCKEVSLAGKSSRRGIPSCCCHVWRYPQLLCPWVEVSSAVVSICGGIHSFFVCVLSYAKLLCTYVEVSPPVVSTCGGIPSCCVNVWSIPSCFVHVRRYTQLLCPSVEVSQLLSLCMEVSLAFVFMCGGIFSCCVHVCPCV